MIPLLITIAGLDPVKWIADYGYVAVFAIVALETAGIPLPGEATMLLAGAATAGEDPALEVLPLIVVASAAAIIGDNVGYAIGRFGGRRLIMRLPAMSRFVPTLEWGERFFERHGGKTVFLARWTAGLRIFGAWIAGMTHMPWPKFLAWNAAGGITWATAVVLLGHFFARSLDQIERYVGRAGAVVAAVVVVALLVYFLRRLHRRQHEAQARDIAEHATSGSSE